MKKLAFALLLTAALGTLPEARAQRISDYTLIIDKRGCDAANMRVDCSFRLDFEEADSVALTFGGDPELSVEHLTFGATPGSKRATTRPTNGSFCAEAERKACR